MLIRYKTTSIFTIVMISSLIILLPTGPISWNLLSSSTLGIFKGFLNDNNFPSHIVFADEDGGDSGGGGEC